ncbi:MAG: TIGR01212 family radical SAM protein [Traorella sp.]
MKNPFIYTDDNKRYHTFNYYLKHHYHCKVFKVPLDAGFTCPNRDGSIAYGGCKFCSALGSGDSILQNDDLMRQYEIGFERMKKKWPTGKGMAYFQAYTNTYGPLKRLKEVYEPFIQKEDVLALCIATRADCLSDEIISYLNSLTQYKDIWIEVGLQTIHDETALRLNRGHTYDCFLEAIQKLSKTNCKICVHIINGLPYETKEMMIQTVKEIAKLPIHALKIHMLHLLKNTQLANEYQHHPFHLLSLEEYVEIVCEQLTYLPSEIILERLTGDGLADDLIAPSWTTKKVCVLNEIDKYMAKNDLYQGKNIKKD